MENVNNGSVVVIFFFLLLFEIKRFLRSFSEKIVLSLTMLRDLKIILYQNLLSNKRGHLGCFNVHRLRFFFSNMAAS